MMMKKYLSYILVACSIPFFSFCSKGSMNEVDINSNTNDKDTDESVVYNIEKALSAVPETKGIDTNGSEFDKNYDPDYIYLHSVDGSKKVEFPVYTFTCEQGNECYGLCYQIRQENGKTTIIPFDKNHELIMERATVLPEDGQFYFSSLDTNEWSLPDEQVEQREGYTFYKRKNNINREIYRSKENFTIETLNESAPLVIHRGCAAFNLVGLFYDRNSHKQIGESHMYTLDSEKFTEIMESDPSTWYIKIYVGGPAFTDVYDLGTQASTGANPGGYYSSGDSKHFEEGSIDANKYLSFKDLMFGLGPNTYIGLGYYTSLGNQLFAPVSGDELHVYILIKHWTGEGEPSDDWLLSDEGALQTEADMGGNTGSSDGRYVPHNNTFYIAGLLIDINDFKSAWLYAGGDLGTATKSGGVREFTLEDAITIFETDSF